MVDVRRYCAACGLSVMSMRDLERHPDLAEKNIRILVNKEIPDPRDPANVVRANVYETHLQKPAMICEGCLQDRNDVPTADARWVGLPPANKK